MRSLGAGIAREAGIDPGFRRKPVYTDFTDVDLDAPPSLGTARRRCGWASRPDARILLVSPEDRLAELMRMARQAGLVVVLVPRYGERIGPDVRDLLELRLVADGDQLVVLHCEPKM